jgi:hypothetical protein
MNDQLIGQQSADLIVQAALAQLGVGDSQIGDLIKF